MEVMSLRNLGFDPNLLETLHDLLDISDEQNQQSYQAPSRRYVREAKAMAATPADVKETKDAYVFVVDVPGLRPDMINVKIEEDNVLVVSGERKKEKERDQGIKYLRMERRLGKYLKKFVLPDNADIERISAECQDGVLTVTVAKKPPPEQKKPKTIQIQISSNQGGGQGGKVVAREAKVVKVGKKVAKRNMVGKAVGKVTKAVAREAKVVKAGKKVAKRNVVGKAVSKVGNMAGKVGRAVGSVVPVGMKDKLKGVTKPSLFPSC
ncbi:hypothetical protein COP2_044165 [Malus domestica]